MENFLLIIGNSFSKLREYLTEKQIDYLVLKDESLIKNPDQQPANQILVNFGNQEAIFAAVDSIAAQHHISGVLVTYEKYIFSTAEIAKHLGLPGLPLEAARACTDKFLMRQKFAEAPMKISPEFAIVNSVENACMFAANHSFPLILKPANLSKSLLVTKNHNLEELVKNYERTMSNIEPAYAKYAPNSRPKLLIEEFLEGSVHSVDAFVDSDGTPHVLDGVVDYQTGYDIGYDDNFHYSRLLPSKLHAGQIEKIKAVAAIGCHALGMKNSPAHIEIILTADGPRIVEIGARNGGYRERMYGLSNNLDIFGNAVKIAQGAQPDIKIYKNEPVAVLELFPKAPGKFEGIAREKEILKLPSLEYFRILAKQGNFVGKSSDGYKMCAIIILHNRNQEQFEQDLSFVNSEVSVVTG